MSAVNVAIVINSPASTSLTFTPGGPFTAPVASGTVLGTFAVAPAGWSGSVALSAFTGLATGSNLSIVNNAGVLQLEAAASLAAGSYGLTATASP